MSFHQGFKTSHNGPKPVWKYCKCGHVYSIINLEKLQQLLDRRLSRRAQLEYSLYCFIEIEKSDFKYCTPKGMTILSYLKSHILICNRFVYTGKILLSYNSSDSYMANLLKRYLRSLDWQEQPWMIVFNG